MSKKIAHLVVDTTAFIKAANLQNIAENIYTVQEVLDEITNDRQRKKLVVLPYDLKVKDVFSENIKFISDFAKKTGDYTSLSATDLKVMALAYQLEKENVGTNHLKTEPSMQKTIKVSGLTNFELNPKTQETQKLNEIEKAKSTSEPNLSSSETYPEPILTNNIENPLEQELSIKNKDGNITEIDEDEILAEEIAEQIKNMDLADGKEVENLMAKVTSDDEDSGEGTDDGSDESDDSDSDGGEWITPKNLAEKKKEQDLGEFEEKAVEVACITSDFAMQNVLKQVGLHVTTVDGRIIRQLRTFIFRCTACFKTTSVMTKLFCPKCGHATLKKVAVSIDDNGNQHIHINGRKPLTARGKRFSLPTPRGGQHFQYPILSEDQHIHKRFASKIGRSKTNALDPDYVAGFSPFAVKDVTSKSAVLGVRADKQDIKYWMNHYSKGKKK